jgi:hypothetical protein
LQEWSAREHHLSVDDVVLHCYIRDVDGFDLEVAILIDIDVGDVRLSFLALLKILLLSLLDPQGGV